MAAPSRRNDGSGLCCPALAVSPNARRGHMDGGHSRTQCQTRVGGGSPDSRMSTSPTCQRCVAWAAIIRFVTEARLEDAGSGLAPVTEGWFVVNVRDAEWFTSETRGAACWFANEYGDSPVEFPQFGINVTVLEPGQSGVYHAEANQEAFLVLGGECRLLVEGEERRLRAWDFFHSPPWTEHAFVGAGDAPCVILMVGAHVSPEGRYPVSELAARYGASVEKETSDPEQVYATAERFRRGRPPDWAACPGARAVRSKPRGTFRNAWPKPGHPSPHVLSVRVESVEHRLRDVGQLLSHLARCRVSYEALKVWLELLDDRQRRVG